MADTRLLRRAAERAGEHELFLASLLLPMARREGLDDAALASRLGCTLESLPALLLSRRPRLDPASFRRDVERIAERFGADSGKLGEAVRVSDALAALDSEGVVDLLAAARDREGDGSVE